MNRIILIGNGFDLAHGLKTSYGHFIDWFWEQQRKKINGTNLLNPIEWDFVQNNYEEEHYEYKKNDFFVVKFYLKKEEKKEDYGFEVNQGLKDTAKTGNKKETIMNTQPKDNEPSKIQKEKFQKRIELKYNVVYKNKFLELIVKRKKLQNWVDIEELYFEILNNCKERYSQSENVYEIYTVEQLNKDFRQIKEQFETFLIGRNDKIKAEMQVFNTIKSEIIPKMEIDNVDELLLLNFNYTNTVSTLYSKINSEKLTIIAIHGEIVKGAANPIIVGYGDEKSKKSEAIEDLNNNDFFENVKSIKYAETDNYKRLLEWIGLGKKTEDRKDFDIFVFGHSCGNSDRTLLKMLFEDEHCKEIRCFFHQKNRKEDNYSETLDNIYRKFDDKKVFREKMCVKDKKDSLPQYVGIPLFEDFPDETVSTSKKEDETKSKQENETVTATQSQSSEKSLLEKFTQEQYVKVTKPTNEKYTLLENKQTKTVDNDFHIGKYPVTQSLYEEVMGDNPSYFKGKDLPVEQVSWYDAVLFCNRLSEKYNLEKYYKINGEDVTINIEVKGFRLPTEAEWEYAATSRVKYKKETDYARNDKTNKLDDLGWYSENSNDKTHPVGQKQANELGIYDMSGNVWEWCYDLYDSEGSYRVLRGGSWNDGAEFCRVSDRDNDAPGGRGDFIGFRLVLPL